VNLQGVVFGAAAVDAQVHGRDEGGIDADETPRPRGVGAHAGVEVAAHELVAAGGVDVVHARGECGAERPLEADGDLVGVGVRRSGLSRDTMPVLRARVPGGKSWASKVRSTVGPLRRSGSEGRTPREGPGSAALAGKLTTKESENTPAVRMEEMSSKCVLSKKRP
jgi:hypothetical protein